MNANVVRVAKYLETIYVCSHALDRWRERAASHTSESNEEVIAILRSSSKVTHDDYLPMPRQRGTHYYYHKDHDAYFIVEPINQVSCRIITVIVPGMPQVPILFPKKKADNVSYSAISSISETPAQASVETLKALEEVMHRVMPSESKEQIPPYRKYVNMMREMEIRLSGLTKNQPLRKQILAQMAKIKEKMIVLKPEYRKYLNERDNNQSTFRPDGSVNFTAAIMHLLKKTDQQQKEIEVLKTAIAFLSTGDRNGLEKLPVRNDSAMVSNA